MFIYQMIRLSANIWVLDPCTVPDPGPGDGLENPDKFSRWNQEKKKDLQIWPVRPV